MGLYSYLLTKTHGFLRALMWILLTKTRDFLRTLRVLAYLVGLYLLDPTHENSRFSSYLIRVLAYLVGLYLYLMDPTHDNSRFFSYLRGLSIPRGSLLLWILLRRRQTRDFLGTVRVLAYLVGLYLYLMGLYVYPMDPTHENSRNSRKHDFLPTFRVLA